MPLTPVEISLAIAIAAAGSLIHASVGYGIGLVIVPLLALIDPAFVPGPALLSALLLAAIMAYRGRSEIRQGNMAVAVAGLLVGTALAAYLLTVIDRDTLPTVFAVVILIAVVVSASGSKVPVNRATLIGAGMGAGLMGTMSAIPGPPIALLYQRHTGAEVRATLGLFFVVAYIIGSLSLAVVGLFGRHELVLTAILLPGIVLGYAVSPVVSRFLDRGYLRIAILVVAAASAVMLLIYG